MADYKNIKGFNIQYLDSDPPNPIEGQMWFNSTTQTLKGAEVGGAPVGTWASGGDLNQSKTFGGGAGTQTATLIFGGNATPITSNTEAYNGSSWTEVNNLNTGREGISGNGTQTAAFSVGGTLGSPPGYLGNTEIWDGTSWTEVNDTNNPRWQFAGAGWNKPQHGLFAWWRLTVDGVGGYTANQQNLGMVQVGLKLQKST
jgi:hypothetical protein